MRTRNIVYPIILGLIIYFCIQAVITDPVKVYLNQSACDRQVTYMVGKIDSDFKVSEGEFRKVIFKAVSLWNDALDKPVFLYDPSADLRVHLLYDERQFQRTALEILEGKIENQKQDIEPEIVQYESDVLKFRERADALNDRIEYWNSQGGAPPEEYDQLMTGQNDLRAEAQRLNDQARLLNITTESYNSQIVKLYQTVEQYNEIVEQKPEEGIYRPSTNEIELYYNSNRDELIHNLAHEFGHVIGLDHIDDPKAIMYKYSSRETGLTENDLAALQKLCRNSTRKSELISLADSLKQAALRLSNRIMQSY